MVAKRSDLSTSQGIHSPLPSSKAISWLWSCDQLARLACFSSSLVRDGSAAARPHQNTSKDLRQGAESCEDHTGCPLALLTASATSVAHPWVLLVHKCAQGGKGTTQIDAETENGVRGGPSLKTSQNETFISTERSLNSRSYQAASGKSSAIRERAAGFVAACGSHYKTVSLPGLRETKANTQKQQAAVGSGCSHPSCANRPAHTGRSSKAEAVNPVGSHPSPK